MKKLVYKVIIWVLFISLISINENIIVAQCDPSISLSNRTVNTILEPNNSIMSFKKIYDLKFFNDSTAILFCNPIVNTDTSYTPILKTIDGGKNWKKVQIGLTNYSSLKKGNMGFYNDFDGYFMIFGLGKYGLRSYILSTTDAGDSWNCDTLPIFIKEISYLKMFSSKKGYLLFDQQDTAPDGLGGDYYHRLKLLTTEDGFITFKIISNVLQYNNQTNFLGNVSICNENLIFVNQNSDNFHSYYFISNNGGLNWKSINVDVYNGKSFFIDAKHGFVYGSSYSDIDIIKDILYTKDSCKTWQKYSFGCGYIYDAAIIDTDKLIFSATKDDCGGNLTNNIYKTSNGISNVETILCSKDASFTRVFNKNSSVFSTTAVNNGYETLINLRHLINCNSQISTKENISICEGDNYKGHTTSGTYSEKLISKNGCDSIITTFLTVNPLPLINNFTDTIICSSDSVWINASGVGEIQWNGLNNNPVKVGPTQTTKYIASSTNSCGTVYDSILVFVNSSYDIFDTIEIFQGNTFKLPDGRYVDTSGNYICSLISRTGCDSIVNYKLNFITSILYPNEIIDIEVYPNPSINGKFTLKSNCFDRVNISISTLDGRKIYNKQIKPLEKDIIDISYQSVGFFLISIYNDKNRINKVILISK